MKLIKLRLNNFQSFGEVATTIELNSICFLIGPNGAGKTATLQALTRMFSIDHALRRIRQSDFHVPANQRPLQNPIPKNLWIEAEFEFPEADEADGQHAAIPAYFAHMQLNAENESPKLRIRLEASLDEDGEIEESFTYVVTVDEDDEPQEQIRVQKQDRNAIQVHYLPARRNPSDHISYAANSMLGRVLRAANWNTERDTIAGLTASISEALGENIAVSGIGDHLTSHWAALHKGAFYANPTVSFARNEIESLLRHLTVGFTPGPAEPLVDFSRLSDGQQSLLYLSLVLSVQEIGRKVLADDLEGFDIDKLRPAIFTLIAMEEPENSLSPHYLGRVVSALSDFSSNEDAQAIVATHAPSMLKRVEPEDIRYLRLSSDRQTIVKNIAMPEDGTDEYKYVREAVQAFPELYFSRLIIFGEGDSEEIVIPRLLKAKGILTDDASISVVPLGGRHVNHFWRLAHDLGIPQVTLLDLDLARHQGGWGRVRYVIKQLLKFPTIKSNLGQEHVEGIEKWDSAKEFLDDKNGQGWIKFLESAGVFFSTPLDLDFMMLRPFGEAYGVDMHEDAEEADEATIIAVLGKSHGGVSQYSVQAQSLFDDYHKRFKLGSKPSWHLKALAELDDETLNKDMPKVLERMFSQIVAKLEKLPE